MTRALEGITVIAVEQAVAAPYASSRLADAARVSSKSNDQREISHAITTSWFWARAPTLCG
jgi:crotonobetainyl-CoA:carnitine CoA-transferase CaiB-like acyl-CoA transferase